MWIPAIVTAGKPATEPADKSGSPGRHPVRRSWPVKDGLAKVEALAAAAPFSISDPDDTNFLFSFKI
jgi:hypothetical protein